MLVGYLRVSIAEQNVALQRDALLAAGIAPDRIYEDTCSGTVTSRPGLARALDGSRLPKERRAATLLAFVQMVEATAQDDVLDLFDSVVTALFANAAEVGKHARLRTIRDLDSAAL